MSEVTASEEYNLPATIAAALITNRPGLLQLARAEIQAGETLSLDHQDEVLRLLRNVLVEREQLRSKLQAQAEFMVDANARLDKIACDAKELVVRFKELKK